MKIRIKDYYYDIIEVDENDEAFYDKEKKEIKLYGMTNYPEQTIKLWSKMKFQRKRETLIHELTHAYMDAYMQDDHIKEKFDEESIACFMATYAIEIIYIANSYMNRDYIEE